MSFLLKAPLAKAGAGIHPYFLKLLFNKFFQKKRIFKTFVVYVNNQG